ncbi:hypothetical protein BXZ70DRAFT_1008535 [Cristinia sonorae]|uniref:Uncharacterized protein n=1 Tax=Cristinia sonorae TaxID=1940300 RepID=A0A8K0XPE6_9AGAR|nr:hypothetical protein BXZ70DRAFT_1013339 [Cristinia sonorae]KAH8100017.1 hypothetical protein BXZ70DRAFT_1008535 [Cristinia sonorae]
MSSSVYTISDNVPTLHVLFQRAREVCWRAEQALQVLDDDPSELRMAQFRNGLAREMFEFRVLYGEIGCMLAVSGEAATVECPRIMVELHRTIKDITNGGRQGSAVRPMDLVALLRLKDSHHPEFSYEECFSTSSAKTWWEWSDDPASFIPSSWWTDPKPEHTTMVYLSTAEMADMLIKIKEISTGAKIRRGQIEQLTDALVDFGNDKSSGSQRGGPSGS